MYIVQGRSVLDCAAKGDGKREIESRGWTEYSIDADHSPFVVECWRRLRLSSEG